MHTNIILGLDFLSRNKIVVDAELRTVIGKDGGYYLLNLGTPHKHIMPLSPPQQQNKIASEIKLAHHEIRTAHIRVHNKLLELFNENLECFNLKEYTSKPADLIGLIKTWIEQLAGQQIM